MMSGMWIFPVAAGREPSWCGMRWPFWPRLLGASLPAHAVVRPSIFFASG